MFSRVVPRAASRFSRAAQCDAHPDVQRLAKVPSRTWRPVQQHCARRQASGFAATFKEQQKKSPIMFPIAVTGIIIVSGIAVFYIPYYYRNHIIKPYHNFPEPVANKLRRAIFYSSGRNLDVREANRYFRQALQLANEIGMDPFSDDILGIKIAVSALFENSGQFKLAADVLEIMRTDCLRWVDDLGDKHWNDGKRSRVLQRIVQFNVKLAELYNTPYMNEPEEAEKRLADAVTMTLQEKNRREQEGLKQGEGDWMTDDEVGATLEALGNHYEANNAHYLATPLFLQALALCPPKSCHGVVLMNNISTSLAQQTPPPTSSTPSKPNSFPNTPSPPRAELVSNARQWASSALERAATITPPDRDEECDVGCATATHNLGEFLEMEGKIQEARQKYMEAQSLAKGLGFKEGVVNAKAGLQRLKALDGSKKPAV